MSFLKLFCGFLPLLLGGCGGKALSSGPSSLYYRMYDATKPENLAGLTSGSPEEAAAIERFIKLFGDFNAQNIRAHVRETYAEHTYFNDTLKEITDIDELEYYLLDAAANVDSCKVTFQEVMSMDDDYYFRWEMTIVFKKLRKGEPQTSIGITHIRFDKDGKIIFHQDYWDAAANLFEKAPIVGWMIRKIKKRL